MTRVAIVDSNEQVCKAVQNVLNNSADMLVSGAWGSAEEALWMLPLTDVDVVLMEIRLPVRSGIECTRKLKAAWPQLEVLMFTDFEDSTQIFEAFRAGASGYLLKRTPPEVLIKNISEVANGGSPISASVARLLVQSFRQTQLVLPKDSDPLTEREEEVLQWLAQGHSEKEISSQLHISLNTLKSHRKRIYQKLDLHSRDSLQKLKC